MSTPYYFPIGTIVQHFKRMFCTDVDLFAEPNKYLYVIIGYAYDTTHEELTVVYQALTPDKRIFTREFNEFFSELDKTKYPDCKQDYRFVEVNDYEKR